MTLKARLLFYFFFFYFFDTGGTVDSFSIPFRFQWHVSPSPSSSCSIVAFISRMEFNFSFYDFADIREGTKRGETRERPLRYQVRPDFVVFSAHSRIFFVQILEELSSTMRNYWMRCARSPLRLSSSSTTSWVQFLFNCSMWKSLLSGEVRTIPCYFN